MQAFQALSDTEVIVLGSNGNLWLEHGPFGTVPPPRQQIDGNVIAFQALSDTEVLVLGSDRKLWLEHGPFGTVPPPRQQIDGNVATEIPVPPPPFDNAPIVRRISNNERAYRLPANAEIEVESLIAAPAGSETITIACGGPNAVYYHTEGNPPGFGQNDNGDIAPGHVSTFKITAALAFVPRVYLHARHGQTDCVVFYGPINLAGFNPSSPGKVIDFVKKIFN